MNVLIKKRKKNKDKKFKRDISKVLGFRPKNVSLYILALTHKSIKVRPDSNDYGNNERLEFLGDAILDSVVSELLYNRFPTADEGFLTKMRVKIVNGKKLAVIAKEMGLHKLLFANAGKDPSYRIYEDALEAFIGAIQIDRGRKYVKRFIYQRLFIEHIDLNELKHQDENHKSQLIEWSQKYKTKLVFDTQRDTEETDKFISRILIKDELYGKGKASSKKAAEQKASKHAMQKISKSEETSV